MSMLTICGKLQITYKRAGYAASLMAVYFKHLEKTKATAGKWFTGKPVEVDSNYVLTLTVKKHDDFNGVDQTIVTNCRINLVASIV